MAKSKKAPKKPENLDQELRELIQEQEEKYVWLRDPTTGEIYQSPREWWEPARSTVPPKGISRE